MITPFNLLNTDLYIIIMHQTAHNYNIKKGIRWFICEIQNCPIPFFTNLFKANREITQTIVYKCQDLSN
jgi:hypothetical protein